MAPEAALAVEGFLNSADGTRLAFRSWPEPAAKVTDAIAQNANVQAARSRDDGLIGRSSKM